MTPVLAMVGGFLGAGKTTLLLTAARMLRDRGLRTAIITNDQGSELVDTRLAAANETRAAEIAGGCFCCRFSEFLVTAERLLEFGPDVIFAEPVGSCIDLARMMRRLLGGRFHVAPLTVLVDPERAGELLVPGADPDLAYLFRNQIAEADLVCSTKADLGLDAAGIEVRRKLSGRTGEGVAEWLDEVLSWSGEAAGHGLNVDYNRYADAEAALGWLNWQAGLELREAATPAAVAGPFLDNLDAGLTQAGAVIAHLKVFNQAPTGYIKASICRNGEEPDVEGDLMASSSRRHDLVLNLRAVAAPELMSEVVEKAAASLPGKVTVVHCESFRPGPPVAF
jgi:hypothetical protein